MTISPTSTSYPYLAFAQQHGLDYGTVLWASCALDKLADTGPQPILLPQERDALDCIGTGLRRHHLLLVWRREQERRT